MGGLGSQQLFLYARLNVNKSKKAHNSVWRMESFLSRLLCNQVKSCYGHQKIEKLYQPPLIIFRHGTCSFVHNIPVALKKLKFFKICFVAYQSTRNSMLISKMYTNLYLRELNSKNHLFCLFSPKNRRFFAYKSRTAENKCKKVHSYEISIKFRVNWYATWCFKEVEFFRFQQAARTQMAHAHL